METKPRPIKKCQDCGKELIGLEARFPTCKDCYIKAKKQREEGEEEVNSQENKELTFFDTKKKYLMPGWFLLIVFLLGVLIGAWLW